MACDSRIDVMGQELPKFDQKFEPNNRCRDRSTFHFGSADSKAT